MLVVSMGVVIDTSAFAFVMTSLLRKREKRRSNSSSLIQPSIIQKLISLRYIFMIKIIVPSEPTFSKGNCLTLFPPIHLHGHPKTN